MPIIAPEVISRSREWWDGTNKQGKPVSDGVYYWVVYAEPLSETAPFIKNGSVTVINKK